MGKCHGGLGICLAKIVVSLVGMPPSMTTHLPCTPNNIPRYMVTKMVAHTTNIPR